MNNVLVFTPTWDDDSGKLAIHPECEAMIRANVEGFDGSAEWAIGLENPYPIGSHRNVLHQYQRARETFLRGTYDALLTVEHDNVLPDAGALQRMYGTQAAVVYAPYTLRHGANVLSTWQYINGRNLGMSLTNYPEELARYRRDGIGRVSGCGFGCTLIRRNVLETVGFREDGPYQVCPDIPFAEDCLRAGFVAMGRFDVPVAHWEWNERIEAYRSIELNRYTALETANVLADGTFIRLVEGREYALTPAQAAELSRAGYIEAVLDSRPEYAAVEAAERAVLPKGRGRKVR